jgi:Flp pilus assembly protein TadG
MAITTRQSLWQSEKGAELIEFALVAPLLILLFAAIVDFGNMFRCFEVVTNAAREGARVGVLPNYDEPEILDRVDDYLKAAGLNATYPPPDVDEDPVPTPAGTYTAVSVFVEYPYQLAILSPAAAIFGGGNFGTVPLRARATMRKEAAAAPAP